VTKSNPLEPPKLATWLLERFSLVLDAPLAGDITEAFRQGRSPGWYWKQVLWAVLVAILHWSRKQWGRLAYAVACGGLISLAWFSMPPVTARTYVQSFVDEASGLHWERLQVQEVRSLPLVFDLYARSYAIHWPWSLVYQVSFQALFQGVFVVIALFAYFGFSRTPKVQNSLRALMIVAIVLAASNVVVTCLSAIQPLLHSASWLVLTSAPTTIALLIAMQVADPATSSRCYSQP
jgi:hypothetical protein